MEGDRLCTRMSSVGYLYGIIQIKELNQRPGSICHTAVWCRLPGISKNVVCFGAFWRTARTWRHCIGSINGTGPLRGNGHTLGGGYINAQYRLLRV